MDREVPDYFELFGLARRFGIDRSALERRFYELSRETHPDRFATAGPERLKQAVERMSLLNEGYRTLKDASELRTYFLRLEGFEAPTEKAALPTELAESWFELQDAVTDDPVRAPSLIADFERMLAESISQASRELVEIERGIDETQEQLIPRERLQRLSEGIRAQSYLKSLERDVARIKSRILGQVRDL